VATVKRSAKAGTGVMRFTGRFARRALAPGSHRLPVTATKAQEKAGPKHASLRVVRG
jgi:hypothetical protein